MKKILLALMFLVMVIGSSIVFVGCGGEQPVSPAKSAASVGVRGVEAAVTESKPPARHATEDGSSAVVKSEAWFKGASDRLVKYQDRITIAEEIMSGMTESYRNAPFQEWSLEDRYKYDLWSSDLVPLKKNYNKEAAEYNTERSKLRGPFVEFKLYALEK